MSRITKHLRICQYTAKPSAMKLLFSEDRNYHKEPQVYNVQKVRDF